MILETAESALRLWSGIAVPNKTVRASVVNPAHAGAVDVVFKNCLGSGCQNLGIDAAAHVGHWTGQRGRSREVYERMQIFS